MKQNHIPNLVINKMTSEQYEREFNAGRISDDEIYLVPDEAGSQADWAQNDDTASDYVKNRTHYSEYTEGVLFSEEVSINMGGEAQERVVGLTAGLTYSIAFNGTTYEGLVGKEVLINDAPSIAIGNLTLLEIEDETNIDLPICIYETPLYLEFGILADVVDGNYAVTVSGERETVKQIDNKYLPKAVSNLVAGELPGSLRTVHAREEDEEYKLGIGALATGYYSEASGDYSHAEGDGSIANGSGSHAEGFITMADGKCSHAEGQLTVASGDYSHAEGEGTVTGSAFQHAQGKYNIEDIEDKYAHIVGNGVNGSRRSNIHTLDWDGLGWFASSVKVGGTGQDDVNAKTLATEEYVNTAELITTADIDSLWGTELLDASDPSTTF